MKLVIIAFATHLLFSSTPSIQAFTISEPVVSQRTGAVYLQAREHQHDNDDSFLFDDFKTSKGEVVHPYHILKVGRSASRQEIKKSYFALSRKYHPDGFRQKRDMSILPGSCNSLEEVSDHWERIKIAYEILSSKKLTMRYQRNEFLSKPGAVLQRAALNAVGQGLQGLGKGLVRASVFTVQHVINDSAMAAETLFKRTITEFEKQNSKDDGFASTIQNRVQGLFNMLGKTSTKKVEKSRVPVEASLGLREI